MKYALGLKPLTFYADDGVRLVYVSNNTLTLEVTRARTSTAVIIPEASVGLATWEPVEFAVEWKGNVGEDRERIHYLIQKPEGDACFRRLRIELDE